MVMKSETKECKETRALCKKLKALGVVVYAATANRFSVPGWPDRWICHRLWTGWLEFKSDDGILRPDQKACIRQIVASGGPGVCWVVRGESPKDMGWEQLHIEDYNGVRYGSCPNDPSLFMKLLNTVQKSE